MLFTSWLWMNFDWTWNKHNNINNNHFSDASRIVTLQRNGAGFGFQMRGANCKCCWIWVCITWPPCFYVTQHFLFCHVSVNEHELTLNLACTKGRALILRFRAQIVLTYHSPHCSCFYLFVCLFIYCYLLFLQRKFHDWISSLHRSFQLCNILGMSRKADKQH